MGKITFVPAQSLPLDRLVASSANVRRIKAGVSVAELGGPVATEPEVRFSLHRRCF